MLERLVLKKYAECTSQRVKWTSGARDMIIVHACTMIIVHEFMSDDVGWGGPGGEAPRENRGGWGAAGPPMVGQ